MPLLVLLSFHNSKKKKLPCVSKLKALPNCGLIPLNNSNIAEKKENSLKMEFVVQMKQKEEKKELEEKKRKIVVPHAQEKWKKVNSLLSPLECDHKYEFLLLILNKN